ncbi:GNAT family N-acetyltransferase [Paenibacillus puldeungensis]|uniref:GNAT family N-acetyltransferase n=1 Tax=Paenibacillus puldeungensis TaxID=696536 RepID=A0ABW3RZX3_9BACL
MAITFHLYKNEEQLLIQFLTGQTWPYHGTATLTEENVRNQLKQGRYVSNEEQKTFWIQNEAGVYIGLIRVYDLADPTPLFDIRIGEKHRGHKYGLQTVIHLIEYVFTNYDVKIRIEGYTRADNLAMRKTFHNAGFVKEAVHRKSWPSENGELFDSIGYAILKEDWVDNKTTPVQWNDLPY